MVRVKTQNIRLIQAQDSQNGWMVKVLQRFKHAHSGYIKPEIVLPYTLAYKSQNLRQNLDLKVGVVTYTRVIK